MLYWTFEVTPKSAISTPKLVWNVKNKKSKDYCKADLKQRILFFITCFHNIHSVLALFRLPIAKSPIDSLITQAINLELQNYVRSRNRLLTKLSKYNINGQVQPRVQRGSLTFAECFCFRWDQCTQSYLRFTVSSFKASFMFIISFEKLFIYSNWLFLPIHKGNAW